MSVIGRILRWWVLAGIGLALIQLLAVTLMVRWQERLSLDLMRQELLQELIPELHGNAEQQLSLFDNLQNLKSVESRCQELESLGWSVCMMQRDGTAMMRSRSLELVDLIPSSEIMRNWWHELNLTGVRDHRMTNLHEVAQRGIDLIPPSGLVMRLLPDHQVIIGLGRTFTSVQARYVYMAQAARERLWVLSTVVAFVLTAALIGATLLLRRSLRIAVQSPLRALSAAIDGVSDGRLDQRLPSRPSVGEVYELEQAFNRMSSHLERSRSEVTGLTANLERLVEQRTADLAFANAELESFAYSISHDLKAPLRAVRGFTAILKEECAARLDDEHRQLLQRVDGSAERMSQLIDDLLRLSKFAKAQITVDVVRVDMLFRSMFATLAEREPHRRVEVIVTGDIIVHGDLRLMQAVVENLAQNAWKYTSAKPQARIDVRPIIKPGHLGFSISDDGAGFDMAYAQKMFTPFQRFHRSDEFPGNGIGLATVSRVVRRHGGIISGEGQVGSGATFTILMPERTPEIARLALMNDTPATDPGKDVAPS